MRITTTLGLALLLVLVTMFTAQAQFFEPVAKPKFNRFAHSLMTTDSVQNLFRPVAVAAAYGYEKTGSKLMVGSGVGYKHLQYDPSTSKWNSLYSFNLIAWAGGDLAPGGTIPAFAVGPTIGFLNDVLMIGATYDFTNHQIGGVLVVSLPTNN